MFTFTDLYTMQNEEDRVVPVKELAQYDLPPGLAYLR